jgi:predicted lactoylglutathione lyase
VHCQRGLNRSPAVAVGVLIQTGTEYTEASRAEVEAFHAAALKAGGTENGAPGLRRENYYAAFVLDSDGNNIEAVFRGDA